MRRTQTSTTRSPRPRRNVSRRRIAALMLVAGVFTAPACASAGGPEEPEFPDFTAPLVDAAGVVPDDEEAPINQELLAYQERSGNQIAVAIVETIGDQPLEDYSIDLAKEWGVGTEEGDNGILLFLAIQERQSRVEVGEGIEGEMTDLEAGRLVRGEMRSLLQDGDYGEAILIGTRAIRRAIGDDQVAGSPQAVEQPTDGRRNSRGLPSWIFGVIPFVIFPLIFGNRRRSRASPVYWGGGTVAKDRRGQRSLEDRRRRRRDEDDDDDGSGWLGAAILGSILLGGGRHGGGGWGGGDSGGGGFDFGGGGGGDFGGGGASGDW
jgi:uncharacterized protein